MKRPLILIFLFLLFTSCKNEKVKGIIIADTLLVHQSYSDYVKLKNIIENCLDQKPSGFYELSKFSCGGGAGCYDLGYILSQIVYRIGEENYLNSVKNLDKNTQGQLSSLIKAGLEYGDNNYDNIPDNRNLKTEFINIYNLTEN